MIAVWSLVVGEREEVVDEGAGLQIISLQPLLPMTL
jgi:hypothetical protein